METYAVRLTQAEWTYLGGTPEAAEAVELVVRALDQDVLAATGTNADAPEGEPVRIPLGAGRRLVGHHFFVRPSDPDHACRVTHRGLRA